MSKENIFKEVQIFSGLNAQQIEALINHGEERQLPEDTTIFSEGESGSEMFVLLEGRVQITMTMEHQSEQVPVHTVIPGKVFGEFVLAADDLKRSATACTVKESRFFVLSYQAFEQLSSEDPQLGYLVLKELSQVLVRRIIKTTKELRASLLF